MHGPIALLSTLPDAQEFVTKFETSGTAKAQTDWIYAGYKFTVFSNQEEEMAKGLLGGGEMKFYPQDALTQAGGQFSQPVKVVVDALPGVVFMGRVASLGPASGVSFSTVAPHNATGNFTKIVQRLPVRIHLDPGEVA